MKEWIGVDLDGTLAYYDRFRGAAHIGKPIPAMVKRVQHYIAIGHTVKVFTARMAEEQTRAAVAELIGDWTEEFIGVRLEATCMKDRFMIRCYDDKAIQVQTNTGKIVVAKNKMKDK